MEASFERWEPEIILTYFASIAKEPNTVQDECTLHARMKYWMFPKYIYYMYGQTSPVFNYVQMRIAFIKDSRQFY